MQRVLEPEIMVDIDQCREYYRANRDPIYSIVLTYLRGIKGRVADLGCGPAQIDKVLCDHFSDITIDAYDGSHIMLDIAREHIGDHNRINLIHSKFQDITESYDTVISMNTLHHIEEPKLFWDVVSRISNRGARIFVLDLCRPESKEDIPRIVDSTTEFDDPIYKEDYRNSLAAAFTEDELRQQVKRLGLKVEKISFPNVDLQFLVAMN